VALSTGTSRHLGLGHRGASDPGGRHG
jgi:hypothetical protein